MSTWGARPREGSGHVPRDTWQVCEVPGPGGSPSLHLLLWPTAPRTHQNTGCWGCSGGCGSSCCVPARCQCKLWGSCQQARGPVGCRGLGCPAHRSGTPWPRCPPHPHTQLVQRVIRVDRTLGPSCHQVRPPPGSSPTPSAASCLSAPHLTRDPSWPTEAREAAPWGRRQRCGEARASRGRQWSPSSDVPTRLDESPGKLNPTVCLPNDLSRQAGTPGVVCWVMTNLLKHFTTSLAGRKRIFPIPEKVGIRVTSTWWVTTQQQSMETSSGRRKHTYPRARIHVPCGRARLRLSHSPLPAWCLGGREVCPPRVWLVTWTSGLCNQRSQASLPAQGAWPLAEPPPAGAQGLCLGQTYPLCPFWHWEERQTSVNSGQETPMPTGALSVQRVAPLAHGGTTFWSLCLKGARYRFSGWRHFLTDLRNVCNIKKSFQLNAPLLPLFCKVVIRACVPWNPVHSVGKGRKSHYKNWKRARKIAVIHKWHNF